MHSRTQKPERELCKYNKKATQIHNLKANQTTKTEAAPVKKWIQMSQLSLGLNEKWSLKPIPGDTKIPHLKLRIWSLLLGDGTRTIPETWARSSLSILEMRTPNEPGVWSLNPHYHYNQETWSKKARTTKWYQNWSLQRKKYFYSWWVTLSMWDSYRKS